VNHDEIKVLIGQPLSDAVAREVKGLHIETDSKAWGSPVWMSHDGSYRFDIGGARLTDEDKEYRTVWQPHLDFNQCLLEVLNLMPSILCKGEDLYEFWWKIKRKDKDIWREWEEDGKKLTQFDRYKTTYKCVFGVGKGAWPVYWYGEEESYKVKGSTPQEAILRACLAAAVKGKVNA